MKNVLCESARHEEKLAEVERHRAWFRGTRNGKQAVMFHDDVQALMKFYFVCERTDHGYKNKCELAMAGDEMIFDANGMLLREKRYER